jgi:hypothetical protein
MPSTIDSRYNALGLLGFEGGASDRITAWLRSQVEGEHVSDLWSALFDQAGIEPGARNDRFFIWLGQQGAAGDSLPDRAHSYWTTLAAQLELEDIR